MYPDRTPPAKVIVPDYPKQDMIAVPPYRPKKGGLAEMAAQRIQPLSKQRRDPQKERMKPRKPAKVKTWLSEAQLAAKNAKRREKRNSDGFAFDADCVQRPSGGSGNAARYDPTPKQKVDQKRRDKKHQHARKWC